MIWTAQLYEVFHDQRRDEKATQVESYTFDAPSHDAAKKRASSWLLERGVIGGSTDKRMRSVSFLANVKNGLAVVVSRPRT